VKKLQRWLLIAVRSERRDRVRMPQSFARKYGVRRMASPWKRRKCGYRVSELIGTSVMCIESAWVSRDVLDARHSYRCKQVVEDGLGKLAARRHWACKVLSL